MKTFVSISDDMPTSFKDYESQKHPYDLAIGVIIRNGVIKFEAGYKLSNGRMHCYDVELSTPAEYDKLIDLVDHYAAHVDRGILHQKIDEMFIKALSFKRFMTGA